MSIFERLQPIIHRIPSVRASSIFVTEIVIRVGNIDLDICITLWRTSKSDKVHFTQSHFIHTPTQISWYVTSDPIEDDEEHALDRAIRTITEYYDEAVNKGHKPDISWFKKNENYPYT